MTASGHMLEADTATNSTSYTTCLICPLEQIAGINTQEQTVQTYILIMLEFTRFLFLCQIPLQNQTTVKK